MVRCGMVSHPREWDWLGYHEIMGVRRRDRLLDGERLGWRLGTGDIEEVRRNWEAALAEAIARGQVQREPSWTESLAVGSAGFVEKIKPLLLSRRETEVIQTVEGLSVLQESAVPYGQKTGSKNGSNEQY
jgi:putative transposase